MSFFCFVLKLILLTKTGSQKKMNGTSFTLSEKIKALTPLLKAFKSKQTLFLLMLVSICFIGWLAVSFIPNKYESSAKVYADTRSLLKPLLHGIAVHSDKDEDIRIIAQNLLSRPNLESIAMESGLYLNYPTPESYEVFLMNFQKEIQLIGSRRQNLFTISYRHNDARIAKKVVELTLQKLVDSTVFQSRADSDIATDFLVSQIAEQLIKLETIEQELVKFKRDNQAYLSYGNSYMQEISSIRQSLRDVDIKITEKRAELDSLQSIATNNTVDNSDNPSSTIATPYDAQIGQLAEVLTSLKIKYTSQHPDIQEIEAVINDLKEKQMEYRDEVLKVASQGLYSGSESNLTSGLSLISDNVIKTRTELNALSARRDSLLVWLDDRLNLINVIPDVEARLTALTREYESTREMYSNLLKRRDSAELSRNVNENTNEVKFRVLEPPTQPLVPSGTSRTVYYFVVAFFAIFFSTLISLGASQVNSKINSIEHIRQITDLKIVGTFKMYGESVYKSFLSTLILVFVVLSLLFCLSILVFHEYMTGQSILYWIKGGL